METPPERAHRLSLPQLLLPASPLAAALISGNKKRQEIQHLFLAANPFSSSPCPSPRPISYSICSSYPTLEPPSNRARHYQGQSSSFVMISFTAIVFNPYRTNRWVKKKKANGISPGQNISEIVYFARNAWQMAWVVPRHSERSEVSYCSVRCFHSLFHPLNADLFFFP